MKPLYSAQSATEAHMIRGLLEAQGIPARVQGGFLAGGIGELPADVCKVWVNDDSQLIEADHLLRAFLKGEPAMTRGHEKWQCSGCSETLEGQFTACSRCGRPRA
jgi:hypothetical protein